MKLYTFLKPTIGKVLLTIILFIILFALLIPICVDPELGGWEKLPDSDIWGCHSQLHRYVHFIPDWLFSGSAISLICLLIFSYLLAALIAWIYSKLNPRKIVSCFKKSESIK